MTLTLSYLRRRFYGTAFFDYQSFEMNFDFDILKAGGICKNRHMLTDFTLKYDVHVVLKSMHADASQIMNDKKLIKLQIRSLATFIRSWYWQDIREQQLSRLIYKMIPVFTTLSTFRVQQTVFHKKKSWRRDIKQHQTACGYLEGTCYRNDNIRMSMRRKNVAKTSVWRHVVFMCPLERT